MAAFHFDPAILRPIVVKLPEIAAKAGDLIDHYGNCNGSVDLGDIKEIFVNIIDSIS